MAQVTYNEDEQVFEIVEESTSDPIAEGVDQYLEQIQEDLPEESEVPENEILFEEDPEHDIVDDISVGADLDQEDVQSEVPDTVEIPLETPPDYELFNVDTLVDLGIEPYSSVPSIANFTPTAWQVNLAEGRQLGEHYLMYAVRQSYGASSYYWNYYLILGRDISYEDDIYTYSDCDVYSYYNYSSTVYYELSVESGSVDGSVSLVYSDLYFDYVGVDPVVNSYPFISFALFILIFVLILIGGRKNV